jgi:NTE family protein
LADPIRLKDQPAPAVDRNMIGISYSGGGALVVIEIGIASAFIKKGIIPAVITGASAGALAGTAHALDPVGGKGIQLAIDILSDFSNSTLGLTPLQIIGRVITEREKIKSLGDNGSIGKLISDKIQSDFGLHNVTIGFFKPPEHPRLFIATTDAQTREGVWMTDEIGIEDAVIASSAIPGVFPWKKMTVAGQERFLVDGGVVMNQPLTVLVEQGCGTIYACAVGSTDPLAPPQNALDNALRAVNLAMHQSIKLEETLVQLKLNGQGVVNHIHPPITSVSGDNFDFTPQLVRDVVAEAESKTLDWLTQLEAGTAPN